MDIAAPDCPGQDVRLVNYLFRVGEALDPGVIAPPTRSKEEYDAARKKCPCDGNPKELLLGHGLQR
jgi:hypothetical protein